MSNLRQPAYCVLITPYCKNGKCRCLETPKIYVKCPDINTSMYMQAKLRDVFGFKILSQGNKPHKTNRFVVTSPPPKYRHHLPLILEKPSTSNSKDHIPDFDEEGREYMEHEKAWDLFCLIHKPITNTQ